MLWGECVDRSPGQGHLTSVLGGVTEKDERAQEAWCIPGPASSCCWREHYLAVDPWNGLEGWVGFSLKHLRLAQT